jgi:hypothetical protein
MNDKPESARSPDVPVIGDEARRKFVRRSGGMVLAAPAVVLLLSAHATPADAGNYYGPPKGSPSPKKNLLDPD